MKSGPATTLFALAIAATLTGCAAGASVPSFESSEQIDILEQDERGLWYQSEDFDEQVRYSGAIYADDSLHAYLQDVTDSLFPEFVGNMRIHALTSPVPNAFVIPNGSIYIDAGLLAQLDNEAQLAAILAHEGSHFVHRHSLRSARTTKQNLAIAAVLGPAIRVPSAAQILAYSSIMGYSRDLEREADSEGFKRMLAAGYDTGEAVRVFERLARHAKYMDYDEPMFFSSHPRMTERIDTFRALSSSTAGGDKTNVSAYRAATARITDDFLDAAAQRDDHKLLIFLLETEGKLRQLPTSCQYYLAEAYRRRNEAGDMATAERYYRATLTAVENHGKAHGALGLLLMKSDRPQEARQHLARYLELSPQASDRAYIERYLAELGGETQ